MKINASFLANFTRSYTPLLIILLVVASFFLGVYVTKVQYLEQQKNAPDTGNTVGQGAGGPAPQSFTVNDIKTWAKEIGLDSKKFDSCLDDQKNKNLVDTDTADGRTIGVNGTPTFYINGIPLVGAQPFAAFKDILDKELAGTTEGTAQRATVDKGHLPPLGKTDAAITIVEFSDFECPYCRRFFTDAFPQIKKEYLDTGKAALYYRHFPLDNIHPLAIPFANASECANQEGKFWQMHDKLFVEQGKI